MCHAYSRQWGYDSETKQVNPCPHMKLMVWLPLYLLSIYCVSQDESELVFVLKAFKKVVKTDMQIQFNRMHVIIEDYTRSEERMISCLMEISTEYYGSTEQGYLF